MRIQFRLFGHLLAFFTHLNNYWSVAQLSSFLVSTLAVKQLQNRSNYIKCRRIDVVAGRTLAGARREFRFIFTSTVYWRVS